MKCLLLIERQMQTRQRKKRKKIENEERKGFHKNMTQKGSIFKFISLFVFFVSQLSLLNELG